MVTDTGPERRLNPGVSSESRRGRWVPERR
jgi:hypothetical protein